MRTIRVGLQAQPQHGTVARMREAWLRADDLGADTLYVWDHFFPLSGDPDGLHYECWILLAAMAEAGRRSRVLDDWCGKVGRDPATLSARPSSPSPSRPSRRTPSSPRASPTSSSTPATSILTPNRCASWWSGVIAADHGVGSCIGWFHGACRDEAKRILGVPPDCVLRTAISFGYPDETALRARPKLPEARKPLSALAHRKRYA